MRTALTLVSLSLAAGCSEGSVDLDDDPQPSSCADALVSYDFEGGPLGFTSEETDDAFASPWEHGTPAPQDCHSGDGCWVTGLEGEYDNCEAGALVSPVLDLTACAGEDLRLSFWHLYQLEGESNGIWYDGAMVQVSSDGGANWDEVKPSEAYTGIIEGNFSDCENSSEFYGLDGWSGAGEGWSEVTVELGSELLTSEFRFRFWFASDRGVTEEGWYIDDVIVSQ